MSRRKTKRDRKVVIAAGGAQQARDAVFSMTDLVEVIRKTHRRMWWWRIIAVVMMMVAAGEGAVLLGPTLTKGMGL